MMIESSTPKNYSTVCPYLMVDSIEKQMDFLQNVFNADIKENLKNADGISMHGEVVIGNAVIMLGRGSAGFPSQPSMNYIYVTDADGVYKKALELGAASIYAPDDKILWHKRGRF